MYFDALQKELQSSGAPLSIYGSPVVEGETWLKPQTVDAARYLIDAALGAVANRPDIEQRIQQIRLSTIYAQLEQAKRLGTGEYGLFEPTADGGWQVKTRWPILLDRFVAGCKATGMLNVHERRSPPEEYAEETYRFFAEGMEQMAVIDYPAQVREVVRRYFAANSSPRRLH